MFLYICKHSYSILCIYSTLDIVKSKIFDVFQIYFYKPKEVWKLQLTCIAIEILWIKLKYDLMLNSLDLTAHICKSGVSHDIKQENTQDKKEKKRNLMYLYDRQMTAKVVFSILFLGLNRKKKQN